MNKKQLINQMNGKDEFKLITTAKQKLSKLLNNISLDNQIKDIPQDKELIVMDNANICMVVAKTEFAKIILKEFIESDRNEKDLRIPELDYNSDKIFKSSCKYSTDYLKIIIDFMK